MDASLNGELISIFPRHESLGVVRHVICDPLADIRVTDLIGCERDWLNWHLLARVRIYLDLGRLVQREHRLKLLSTFAEVLQVDCGVNFGMLLRAIDHIGRHVTTLQLLQHLKEERVQDRPLLTVRIRLDTRVHDVHQAQLVALFYLAHQIVHMFVEVDIEMLLVR